MWLRHLMHQVDGGRPTNRPVAVLGLLAAMIAVSASARAAIINVPGDFARIQDAIADPGTVNGDEIIVAPGVYPEAPHLACSKPVGLRCRLALQ